MKAIKILIVLVGVFSLSLAVYTYFLTVPQVQAMPVIARVVESTAVKISPTEEVVPTNVPESTSVSVDLPTDVPTVVPTPTTTPEPQLVQEYMLEDKINLSEGSTALNIRIDGENLLTGYWAEAISNQYVDRDPEFDPHNGTIYSILGDTTVLGAHSGTVYGNPFLFASNVDLYLRKGDNSSLKLAEGVEKTNGLIGKTAFLCQTEAGVMEKFSPYDSTQPCPGVQVELKIVAAALVQEPMVNDYSNNLVTLRSWSITNYPEAKFADLNPDTGFVLITCVGRYPDQPILSGVPDYEYNRLIVGFEVVP